jgi:hypothetical protein
MQYKYIFKGSEKGAYAFSLHEIILAHKYEQTMNKGEIFIYFFGVGSDFFIGFGGPFLELVSKFKNAKSI